MKKMLTFVVVITVALILRAIQEETISFDSPEAEAAHRAKQKREWQEAQQLMEKGKTDDATLREAISRLAHYSSALAQIFHTPPRNKLTNRP